MFTANREPRSFSLWLGVFTPYKKKSAGSVRPIWTRQGYYEENDRPQPKLDRMLENGMAVSIGRLREDNQYDYKFVCLSHNTLRGAAGGAVLLAELLAAKGYFD